jgi:histidinol-phosphatase (PHP family)
MKVDLHSHTPLCNHAEGSVDEYVEKAIACGIDTFGFSDHAPMHFDPKYRMGFEQMESYRQMVLDARAKYADRIEVLFGYEVDYLPGFMDERVLNAEVDFMIGSVHFIDKWGFDNPEFIGRYEHEDIDHIWKEYFKIVEAMAESGLFDIVGHLDLIKVFKFMPKQSIESIAANAIRSIKKADMAIEINVAGYRKPVGEAYPSRELLQMAFDEGIPITFGSDAHKPEQVGLFREEAEQLARSVGYTRCATFKNRQRSMVAF